jgi:wyosine [tRNA(Phe)-imidazoG37] synthetase (radical SAM superfamily)
MARTFPRPPPEVVALRDSAVLLTVPSGYKSSRWLGVRSGFHVMAKPTGATCNLDCEYCFFLSKEMLYPGSRFRMAEDLQEAYIKQLLEAHSGSLRSPWPGRAASRR